jgi:hypothetical protein
MFKIRNLLHVIEVALFLGFMDLICRLHLYTDSQFNSSFRQKIKDSHLTYQSAKTSHWAKVCSCVSMSL